MAGKRSFETQFIINAVLNGGFKATLTEAQKEFLRLEEEIKKLNAVQKDVSAYQNLQKAIDNTSEKLKYLEERQKHVSDQKGFLEKQIEEAEKAGTSTAALNRSKAALEERESALAESFRKATAAMEAQEQKADTLAGRLEKAGLNLDNLGEASKKNAGELEQLKRAQERVAEGAAEAGKTGTEAIDAVAETLAAAGVLGGLKKLADGFAECTRTAAEFERAMSAVEAIAGASDQEINALNTEAKRLGASTVFTAQQSAEAMNYMAMAGWNTREMLSGMSGIMNAAAASGEDLASVSDIITDSLTAFGLAAADAGHFSDILAQASARSNTNIGMMGQTFQRAAPVAAALGFSAEDTAVAIGLMANSGIKASRAGTALVNIFNGLLEGVTLTGDAFGEYEFSAIRADGTMKGLAGTLDELRGKFAQMSEAEKVMNAKEIAGLRGYSGLLAILNSTEEEYRSLREEISSCAGAAERMAEVKLDNLSGDVTLMKSAWEGLKITIGEQFTPELRAGAEALTELTGGVDRFVQKAPALVKGLSGAAAGFTAVFGAVTAANSAIKIFHTMSEAGLFKGLSGRLLAASAAIGGLIGIASSAHQEFLETVKSATELDEAVGKLNDTISETTVRDIQNDVLANAEAAEVYLEKVEELNKVHSRSADQEAVYQASLAGLLETMPELSGYISQTADQYGRVTYALEGSTDAIWDNIGAMKQQALVAAYQDKLTEAYSAQTEAETKRQRAILDKTDAQEAYGNLLVRQEELLEKLNTPSASKAQDQEDLDQVTKQIIAYKRQIDEYDESIRNAERDLEESGRNVEAVTAAMNSAADGAGSFAAGMDGAAGSAENAAGPLEALAKDAKKLAEAYRESYGEALNAIQGQYALWDKAEKAAPSNLNSVEKAMESQIANWTARTENLNLLSQYVGDVSGLYTLLGELSRDTSQESTNLLAGLAGADLETLRKFAGVYVQKQESEKKAAETTISLMPELAEASGNLQKLLDESVEEMDKSEASQAAARETIQAYIDEANDPANLAAIRTAFGRAASEALCALNARGGMTQEFLIQIGAEHYTPHAEGGILTAPHLGLVAEDGPEAVIPLSEKRKRRGVELWREAGERLGLTAPTENASFAAAYGNPSERRSVSPTQTAPAALVREMVRLETVRRELEEQQGGQTQIPYRSAAYGNPSERRFVSPTQTAPAALVREMVRLETVRRELADQGGWSEAERGPENNMPDWSAAEKPSGGGAPGISVTFNLTISPGTPEETVDRFQEFLYSSEFQDRIAYIQKEIAYDAERMAFR